MRLRSFRRRILSDFTILSAPDPGRQCHRREGGGQDPQLQRVLLPGWFQLRGGRFLQCRRLRFRRRGWPSLPHLRGCSFHHSGRRGVLLPGRGRRRQQDLVQQLFRHSRAAAGSIPPFGQFHCLSGAGELPQGTVLQHRQGPVIAGDGGDDAVHDLHHIVIVLPAVGVRRVRPAVPQHGRALMAPTPESAVRCHRQAWGKPGHLLQQLLRLSQEIDRKIRLFLLRSRTGNPPEAAVKRQHQQSVIASIRNAHIRHVLQQRADGGGLSIHQQLDQRSILQHRQIIAQLHRMVQHLGGRIEGVVPVLRQGPPGPGAPGPHRPVGPQGGAGRVHH